MGLRTSHLAIALVAITGALSTDACSNDVRTCVPGDSKGCVCTDARQGAQTCNASGTAFGACRCDGSPSTSVGAGGNGAGGGGTTTGSSSAAGGNGPCAPGTQKNCYDGPAGTNGVGTCHGGVANCLPDGSAFGACQGEVVPAPENCATAADEDCDGLTPACPAAWTVVLGDGVDDRVDVNSVALAPNGDVVAGGLLIGTMTFAGTFTAPMTGDGVVTRLTSEGAPIWTHLVKGTGTQTVNGVAVQSTGTTIAVGYSDGPTNFGLGNTPISGPRDGFIWVLDANGVTQSASTLVGGTGEDKVESVAIAANDDVIVGGSYQGLIQVGGIELPDSGNATAYFVARLDPTTTTASWARTMTSVGSVTVRIAPNGDVLAGGTAYQTMDLGFGPVPNAGGYVLRLSATGAPLSQMVVTGQGGGELSPATLAALADNGFVYGGDLSGTVDFGLGPISGYSGLAAHFTPAGVPDADIPLGMGSQGGIILGAFAPVPAGGAVMVGNTSATLVLGGNQYVPVQGDGFIGYVDATGASTTGKLYGAAMSNVIFRSIALAASGAPIVGGDYSATASGGPSLGAAALPQSNAGRGFIARLVP